MRFVLGGLRAVATLFVGIIILLAANAEAQTVNYRSIGTAPADLINISSASIDQDTTTVTFGVLLPADVGPGDELILEPGGATEVLYILSRDSHTQVTVQSPAAMNHWDVPFQIRRAYNTIQLWADQRRDQNGGDLVGAGVRETGIVYDDGGTLGGFTIEGAFTNASHYMKLTVAPGHRHNGTSTIGARIANGDIFIKTDFTVVEWLVSTGAVGNAVNIEAADVELSHLVLYQAAQDGILAQPTALSFTVQNTMISSSGGAGITGAGGGASGSIENCSLNANTNGGIIEIGSDVFSVTNTISLENAPDINVSGSQSNNLVGLPAASEFVAPPLDLHLTSTSLAIDAGLDLSSFHDDIDAQRRSFGRSWDIGADEATSANVFLRSIGTRSPETNLHTIAAVTGSPVIIGNGTTWLADNRGRGDRMTIAGADYTVLFVESDTKLILTTPFTGSSGDAIAGYELARKFSNLAAWEDCIDGGTGCAGVASNSLITDNRREIGIVYDDGLQYDRFVINGSWTDALHDIRLTADGDNRHFGLASRGVVIDPVGAGIPAIEINDEFVTLEWLRITGADGTNTGHGVYVTGLDPPDNRTILKNLLIYNVTDDGIRISDSDTKVLAYNNIIYACKRGISITQTLGVGALAEIYNNTIYNCTDQGGILTTAPMMNPNVVLLKNNIAHSNSAFDYNIAPLAAVHSNSCNNLSSDDTGPTHSKAGGGVEEPSLASMDFVETTPLIENLHIKTNSTAENKGVDLGSIFIHDIDGNHRLPPWDIGADDVNAVTAVDLLRFEATGYDGSVVLAWETGSETDNAGFYVYRSDAVTGPFERVSPSSVAGLGTSPVGALYRYVDSGLENGKTYYYEIEDFELSGRTERHGPVWALPQAGAALPPELSEEPETSPRTSVVYGDPESVSFRELSRNSREVVLELLTGGFYAEPQGDGTVRLTVPGLVESGPTEGPQVPLKRSWVEAIAGRGVRLVSVEAEDVEVFRGLHPMEAGSSGIEVSRRGTVRAVRKRARRRFHASVRGMLPEHRAQVLSTGFQGDVKKAYVELAPLRYDSRRGELQLSRRLVVRLAFTGRVAEEQSLGGSRGRLAHRRSRSKKSVAVAARLGVVESGLYGVSFEELFGRQRRPIPKRWLRLSRQGEPVAFHIDGDAFGRGKNLYFVSEGAGLNPYGPEAVYELAVGVEGERMPVYAMEPTGALTLDTYWQDVEREENHRHGATLLEEANQWFWETILNGTSGSYPFEAQGTVPSVESGRLELRLRGASPEVEPEFVLRVYVNEVRLEELRWMGGESKRFEVAVPPGVVTEGTNTLRLEHATNEYTGVLLDGFTVTYPRASVTESGRLTGTWSGTGPASVSGTLGPVVDVTQVPAVWLGEVEKTETGVRFWAESGHRYEVGVLKPDVRRAGRMRLKRPQKGADYLLIGPREFLMEAEPLLALRRSQGLTTRSISLSDVWMEFGHGEVRPEAIREFLSYAYHEWTSPQVRYVVLLGDGTYDYKDYLGHGVPNVIPPLLARTSYLWTASDPSYGWVNGEDELPDIAIGRLPVETVEETRAVVAKLVAFGEGEGPTGPLVLVADDADHGGDFRASAEEIATSVLWGEELRKIYLGELGVAATRDAIVNAFDSGARLMSYVGHGGTRLWADEQIFDAPAVETLLPQSHQPIVLTINCYTGSFHLPYPDYDSLSEELVKVEDRGAVAAISPSGLSLNTPAHYLHRAYLEELTSGRHDRLGDAIRAAQEAYAATGALPELLTIYHLFGDPAMQIKGLEE